MSLLTGLVAVTGGNGAIGLQDGGTPNAWMRGLAFDANGDLCCQIDTAGDFHMGGFLFNAATGTICYNLAAAIDHYIAGIPVTANGAICIENAAAVLYSQGVPITASGKVAFA